MAVSTAPGRYTLAVIRVPSSSAAKVQRMRLEAGLGGGIDLHAGRRGGAAAIPLETFTIGPQPFAIIPGISIAL
jgi:hypothetical protein